MHWSDWILVLGHSIAIVTSSCEHSKLLFTHYVRSQDSLTSFAHSRLDNNNYLAFYFLKGVTHLFIHSEFFTFYLLISQINNLIFNSVIIIYWFSNLKITWQNIFIMIYCSYFFLDNFLLKIIILTLI